MDIQTVVETATTANAVALGNGIATENFREAVKNHYKIPVNLKTADKLYLKRVAPFPVMFTGTTTITHDHSLVAALRLLARDVYEKNFNISRTTERTLLVGSGGREIKAYAANPSIHHYVYAGENKDVDRIVRPVLSKIVAELKNKASNKDSRIYVAHPDKIDTKALRPAAKRYFGMRQILDDYTTLNKLPNTIHTKPVEATILAFEDSIYNFTPETLINLFNDTGAQLGYGYAFLPMELIQPDLPTNRMYVYTRIGDEAQVTFRNGNSNGYRHKHSSRSMLLNEPVIKHGDTYLVVEIVARLGCMSVFKLMRATKPETVVRTIGLTDTESFVRILDLQSMYDPHCGNLRRPLKYVSVRESEFFDAVNWALTVVSEKYCFKNIANFVRRMNGLSMVTQELVAPWDLAKDQVFNFSLVVMLYVENLMEGPGSIEGVKDLKFPSWWEDKKQRINKWFRTTLQEKFSLLHAILCHYRLQDDLVINPADEITQVGRVKVDQSLLERAIAKVSGKNVPQEDEETMRCKINVNLYSDMPNEETMPSCPICFDLYGKLGAQKVQCIPSSDSTHSFSLTETELGAFKVTLLDSDGDPSGIREVKDRALKKLPKAAFTRKAKVHYIRAGPGCGKSFIVRQLATEDDLVIAPFAKLKPDYEGLRKENGELYNLNFKTTHRSMETTGYRRIFVDEFTSFPYEFLACVVNNNAAEEVFLVGDEKQTRVIEPAEGIYTGTKIELENLSIHELLVNFRNPPDTVALLNKLFGYKMRAAKPHLGVPSIKFVDLTEEEPADIPVLKMCFSSLASKKLTETENNTVRANQGGTFKDCRLYVTNDDKKPSTVECLQVVAMSRHTGVLEVMCDTSTTAEKYKSLIGDMKSWQEEYMKYLEFDDVDDVTVDRSDPVIVKVLGKEKQMHEDTESEVSESEHRRVKKFVVDSPKMRRVAEIYAEQTTTTDQDSDEGIETPHRAAPKPATKPKRRETKKIIQEYPKLCPEIGTSESAVLRNLAEDWGIGK